MKALLEFSLPEESDEHQVALDGHKWRAVTSDLDTFLRNKWKYDNEESLSVADLRSKLREIVNDHGLNLD
jgi:hypothetical protein